MAKDYWSVCDRWLNRLLGRTDKPNFRNDRMPCNDDAIFSYGSHFPMVVATRDRKGQPTALILNGDRFSPTTTRHQSVVRNMADRSGLPRVIVPFSALEAAGVDPIDVEIIETTSDRHEEITETLHTIPAGSFFKLEPMMEWLPVDEAEIERRIDAKWAKMIEELDRKRGWYAEAVAEGNASGMSLWKDYADAPNPPRPTIEDMGGRSTDRNYYWGRWDCDYRRTGYEMRLRRGSGYSPWSWEMETFGWLPTPDGGFSGLDGVAMGVGVALMCFLTNTPRFTFTHTRRRHWLGGSLLRAKIRWTTRPTCRACNGTGTTMGHDEFEAELARLVEQEGPGAYEPDIRWTLRAEVRCQAKGCTGGTTFRRNSRTAYFISDFDANEPNPLYFFCELPRSAKPTSLAEAIEALKPDPVLLAEQIGRRVYRQGDVFAIELPTKTRKDLRQQGARFDRMTGLLGTNHVATEVAHMPDGTTLVRGTMHHRPEWRRPDHVRLKLGDGKTWHAVVKNRVPVSV